MPKILCFFLLLLIISSENIFSQTDTEFWFAAPDITNMMYGGLPLDEPIVIRVATYGAPATVTLDLPSDPTFIPIVKNVNANSSATFDLGASGFNIKSKIETTKNTKKNGIRIISTAKITAYYENTLEANPEIYVLKGRRAMGTEFYLPSQDVCVVDNINWSGATKGFVFVATESGTTQITITPTCTVFGGYPANIPFTITLNEGQTWCGAATSDAASVNFIGTHVTSDKKIAVTVYEDLLNTRTPNPVDNKADLIGDQILPIDDIGVDYIVVPSNLHGYDVGNMTYEKECVIVVATKPNTVVKVGGQVKATLQTGQHFTAIINTVSYINTSEPAYAYHLSGMGQESASALLPALGCSGSLEVAITRSPPVPSPGGNPIILIIITKQGTENGIKINTTKNSYTYNSWPSNKGMQTIAVNGITYVCMAIYDWGDKNAYIPNNTQFTVTGTDLFHLGYYHGFWIGGCRYGYFSDYSNSGSSSDFQVLSGCHFDINGSNSTNGWKWFEKVNTVLDTNQKITTKGQNKLWVETANGPCIKSDTFNIKYIAAPVSASYNICNDSVLLDATVSVAKSYLWNDNLKVPSRYVDVDGNYSIVIDDGKCKTSVNYSIQNNCDSISIPNVFTPNNDGVNDNFFVINHKGSTYKDFNIIIFNRWGKRVFESKDINEKWDGNGASEGVYYYIVRTVNNLGIERKYSGTLTLLK